ncbi:MAG: GNAT family N-acetyltransferase [Clostridiales bacterium]|nr:GNAT family N-acetyltransferase [Clostridiales bacterium]
MITVKEISSKRDKKRFFKFVIDLYKNNPHACCNLYSEEFDEFDPEVNDAFRFADCRMFLAYKDGKIAGRIAGIWHRGVNEKFGYKQLRFTRFDVIDDFEVTKALFDKLFEWAKELGMTEIIGPMSFSDLNEEGMLIDGFDKDSNYIEIYNYPYYVEHMEKLGAYKVVDWNCYVMTPPDKPDERMKRLSDAAMAKYGYEILDVAYLLKHDKKKLNDYVMEALDVMNVAFEHLYGVSPVNEKQKAREAKTIFSVLIPDLATVVLKDGKVIGYGLCIPSLKEVFQKGKGRIFPGGLIPYIKTMKHPKVADMLQIGVLPEHQSKGVPAIIINHCLEGVIRLGIKKLEAGPQLEENRKVQNLWNGFDADLAKRARCWGLKVE